MVVSLLMDEAAKIYDILNGLIMVYAVHKMDEESLPPILAERDRIIGVLQELAAIYDLHGNIDIQYTPGEILECET
jgi:hypothetical protein